MSRLETAEQYDFWCGLWAISYAVGRSARVVRGSVPVFLNTFIILVSESGVGRKSTAINHVERLVDGLEEAIPVLLSGYTTAAQFDAVLEDLTLSHGSSQVGIIISEMARFLGRQSGMKDLPVLLTDLYDCPASRVMYGAKSHKKDGPVKITRVLKAWVSLLTGCTPVWLSSAVHPQVLEGGFSSRTLFITANSGKDLKPWPSETDDVELEKELLNDLSKMRDIATANGEIHLSPGAIAEYSTWYTHRKGARSHYERMFESREPDHILRCAALLCINDGGWEVQRQHIATAIRLITGVKENLSTLFVESDEQEVRTIRGIEKVRETLSSIRPEIIGHRALYVTVRNFLSIEAFRTLMDTMSTMGMVDTIKKKNTRGVFYRGTNLTAGAGKLQSLTRAVSQRR